MSKDLARLFASKFIARPDVKAIQESNGDYRPTVERERSTGKIGKMYGFTMRDLLDHIEGVRTYGHYMLNLDSECKLFAFDIDIDESGVVPFAVSPEGEWSDFRAVPDLRSLWTQRDQQLLRTFLKHRMRELAHKLAKTINEEFDIPTAVTYTGAKGLHVYGFTGLLPAIQVREGAELVLKATGAFEPFRGINFWRHKELVHPDGTPDLVNSYSQFSIEVFPKQTSVEPGGFGNLMRLPLGRNLKNPKDPTFFLDLRANFGTGAFTPRDPVEALTVNNPWK